MLSAVALMTLFELAKALLFPSITLWQSHRLFNSVHPRTKAGFAELVKGGTGSRVGF
jgi:hypothetical protein